MVFFFLLACINSLAVDLLTVASFCLAAFRVFVTTLMAAWWRPIFWIAVTWNRIVRLDLVCLSLIRAFGLVFMIVNLDVQSKQVFHYLIYASDRLIQMIGRYVDIGGCRDVGLWNWMCNICSLFVPYCFTIDFVILLPKLEFSICHTLFKYNSGWCLFSAYLSVIGSP